MRYASENSGTCSFFNKTVGIVVVFEYSTLSKSMMFVSRIYMCDMTELLRREKSIEWIGLNGRVEILTRKSVCINWYVLEGRHP